MNRYIAAVGRTGDGSVESFDFLASSEKAAEGRARITALARYDNPEAFIFCGLTTIPLYAGEDLVNETVAELVAKFNADHS